MKPPPPGTPPRDVMTLAEAADFLRISERQMWQLIKDGKVPGFRVGSAHRFYRRQLEQLGQAE